MFGEGRAVTAVERHSAAYKPPSLAVQTFSEVPFHLITAVAPMGTLGFIYTILSTLGDL